MPEVLLFDDDFSADTTSDYFWDRGGSPLAAGAISISGGKLILDSEITEGSEYGAVIVTRGPTQVGYDDPDAFFAAPGGCRGDYNILSTPFEGTTHYYYIANAWFDEGTPDMNVMIHEDGDLVAGYWDGTDNVYAFTTTFDPVDHAWIRLEVTEDRATFNWYTSPDGEDWTLLYTEAAPFEPSDLVQFTVYQTQDSTDNLMEVGHMRAWALNVEGAESLTVNFNAAGSTGVPALSYHWDFGDGSQGTGVTVSHTYAEAGTYRVTLTLTDANGRTATKVQILTVG
jgi:hypothetical protein